MWGFLVHVHSFFKNSINHYINNCIHLLTNKFLSEEADKFTVNHPEVLCLPIWGYYTKKITYWNHLQQPFPETPVVQIGKQYLASILSRPHHPTLVETWLDKNTSTSFLYVENPGTCSTTVYFRIAVSSVISDSVPKMPSQLYRMQVHWSAVVKTYK